MVRITCSLRRSRSGCDAIIGTGRELGRCGSCAEAVSIAVATWVAERSEDGGHRAAREGLRRVRLRLSGRRRAAFLLAGPLRHDAMYQVFAPDEALSGEVSPDVFHAQGGGLRGGVRQAEVQAWRQVEMRVCLYGTREHGGAQAPQNHRRHFGLVWICHVGSIPRRSSLR